MRTWSNTTQTNASLRKQGSRNGFKKLQQREMLDRMASPQPTQCSPRARSRQKREAGCDLLLLPSAMLLIVPQAPQTVDRRVHDSKCHPRWTNIRHRLQRAQSRKGRVRAVRQVGTRRGNASPELTRTSRLPAREMRSSGTKLVSDE